MTTFNIYKNPDYYTTKHNTFMMTAIRSYPGITVKADGSERISVEATEDAAEFLRHLSDCDLIAMD